LVRPAFTNQTVSAGDGRAFVRRFLMVLLGALAVVGAANYFVNPTGLHAPKIFPTVSWNARQTKADLLKAADPKPQVLVLGSSRAMKIRPALITQLTGLPAFNAAVDAGLMEDDYVMLRYACERGGAQPKLILIGVDVEAFDNHRPSNVGLAISDELAEFAPGGKRLSWWEKLKRLYSWEETKLTWRSLRHSVIGYPTTWNKIENDGYLRYLLYEQDRAKGTYPLDRRVDAIMPAYASRYAAYDQLQPERVHDLDEIMQYAQKRGARVVLFITTLHPRVLATVEPHGYEQRYDDVKALLAKMHAQYGATVYDFSHIEAYGGQPDWFYDGAHVDERNADLLTRRMLEGADAVR
jgi:hypothetical protein